MAFLLKELNLKADEGNNIYERLISAYPDYIFEVLKKEKDIVKFLNVLYEDLSTAYFIRAYICKRFNAVYDKSNKTYTIINDGKKYVVGDYNSDTYKLSKDDIDTYIILFKHLMYKHNASPVNGEIAIDMDDQEIRRLLKMKKACSRKKACELSFALNMDKETMEEFLTVVLADFSYNFRSAEEAIMYFCHTHEEYNNYYYYQEFEKKYKEMKPSMKSKPTFKTLYTSIAISDFEKRINTVEDLFDFLAANKHEFKRLRQTARKVFGDIYSELSEYYDEFSKRERAAKAIVSFIPREGVERTKADGTIIVENEYIFENATLPPTFIKKLLTRDRLDKLLDDENGKKGRKKINVERKDIVFIYFYYFCKELETAEENNPKFKYDKSVQLRAFIEDCNEKLKLCGMGSLCLANPLDNLIMMSFSSPRPYEIFEAIVYYSFPLSN